MHKKMLNTKRLTTVGLLLTAAFVLSWLEMVLSLPMPAPGMKIGLANLAILFTLYVLGTGEALFVLVGRLLLSMLLFGNISSLIFSTAGGLLSFVVMCLCRFFFRKQVVLVSMAGGVFHNIGQLIAASLVMRTPLFYYAPYLILGGIAAGTVNGWIVRRLLKAGFLSHDNRKAIKTESVSTERKTELSKKDDSP